MRNVMAAVIVAGLTMPAAAVVTPNGSFYLKLSGTTAAQDPQLVATVVKDNIVPFSIPTAENVHGTVQVRTVKRAIGKLTFYWKINVAADSKGSIAFLHIDGFPNHAYEADWRPDGLGSVAPGTVGGLGKLFTKQFDMWFQFYQPVQPGQSSRFFYIKTDAIKSGAGTILLGATNGGLVYLAGDAPVF